MNQLPPELAEEAPLDPAAERVRRKMVRLLAVSIGIMFVGLFAVLAAIVWQVGEASAPTLTRGDLLVPDGFSITESDLAADAIMLRGTDTDGAQRLLIFDRRSGELAGDFAIGTRTGVPGGR
jgi:hypothetical protein